MAIFENLKLDKGLYTSEKGFTQALESVDPSENYIGTSLEGLDAYQRQLKRFDIHVNGKNSDSVEKFFKTSDSAALFPEYVNRAVVQGMRSVNQLDKLLATTTMIDSLDYRSITTNDNHEVYNVNEGTHIPSTTIKTKENLVKLHKRGRMLVASYEAVRFQRLDLFTVTLKQIGASIARAQLADAVDVLMNGDGNRNNAQVIYPVGEKLNYEELIALWGKFDTFEMNTLVAPINMMTDILKIEEFRDAAAGLNFHATGKLITPLGAELVRCDDIPNTSIIAMDRNCALEKVQAGEVTTDFDKLIDRQLERAAITSIAGFAKIYAEATKVLEV